MKFWHGFGHERVQKSESALHLSTDRKGLSTDESRQSSGCLALCVSVDRCKGSVDRSTQSRNLKFCQTFVCRQIWAETRCKKNQQFKQQQPLHSACNQEHLPNQDVIQRNGSSITVGKGAEGFELSRGSGFYSPVKFPCVKTPPMHSVAL
ncbi:hypothetical protein Taro_040522 [Colocasia esculenta]|uniref:Uncharacterized protein n=1 Tax=Colocasia esculenta TaxID=4460 RepID=A0A843WDF7_COLES|nr:hypothetical protein [Colocasia esculenta]